MINRLFFTVTLLLTAVSLSAANENDKFLPDRSVVFAEYDTTCLAMDLYLPGDGRQLHDCMIFSYGGGFINDNQKTPLVQSFCRRLADEGGFVVAAINYRLGLRNVKMKGTLSMIKPTRNAVQMATEDLFKALKTILDNSQSLGVDPSRIILCGNSAGAIMSLQADYELCNRTPMTSQFPSDFRFAGVISFAGAIFSHGGKCRYEVHNPAPTFLLHGTSDKLVVYDKIAFFKLRFSGSSDLVEQFKKNGWPHKIMRFKNEAHGVASRMNDNYDDVIWFIENMVDKSAPYEIDELFWDKERKSEYWETQGPEVLYK